VPQKSKKQTQSRPKQKNEPELGQKEAHQQRKSDSELHHMEGAESKKPGQHEGE
jgi:hypothetical protein